MEVIGDRFDKAEIFLPQVVAASKTMEMALKILEPLMTAGAGSLKGCVIMGTVEGDVHDIGKSICSTMLQCAGFEVHDLGRDVPSQNFIDEVKGGCNYCGMSALMTTTMTAFPSAAEKLVADGVNIPFMAAGGAVNRDFAESFPLGIYSEKAPQTPPIADKVLAGYDWKRVRDEWDQIVGGEE